MIEGVLPVNGQDDVEGMDLVKFLFTVRARVARIPRAAFPLESAWPSK